MASFYGVDSATEVGHVCHRVSYHCKNYMAMLQSRQPLLRTQIWVQPLHVKRKNPSGVCRLGLVRKLRAATVLLGVSADRPSNGKNARCWIATLTQQWSETAKWTITTTFIFKQERPCFPKSFRTVNIPGWAATVIKQAVLLLGCCDLHFLQRLGSTRSFLGRVHSRIFGSGGKMRLRVDPPFYLIFLRKRKRQKGNQFESQNNVY